FLRPQSTAEFPTGVEPVDAGPAPEATPAATLPPIAALFDGVPVQAHRLLDGRLILDDPDDLDALSVVTERRHGTEMASLILHGDRNVAQPSLIRLPQTVRGKPGGRHGAPWTPKKAHLRTLKTAFT